MPKPHDWQSLNREVHQPEDIEIRDIIEEIRCVLAGASDDAMTEIVTTLDRGDYDLFGRLLADQFRLATSPNQPRRWLDLSAEERRQIAKEHPQPQAGYQAYQWLSLGAESWQRV